MQKWDSRIIHVYFKFSKFSRLFGAAARIIATFGSTYLCEQFFSSMKVNKSVLRS